VRYSAIIGNQGGIFVERQDPRREGQRPVERKGASRPPDEPRRKRATSERRYAGWNDGIERAFCVHVEHTLPAAIPVHSRTGIATIPATVVGRRPAAILLCTFDHAGPHVWPDGEIVGDEPDSVDAIAPG
jgi:hypothetical protein